MSGSVQGQWVWWSDEASRAAGKLSVLAVVETLLCVAIYWLLLLWFGITWHHWLILIATPLILMRSGASIARGLRWFEGYIGTLGLDSRFEVLSARSLATVILSFVVSFSSCYIVSQLWLGGLHAGPLFWREGLVGILAIIAAFSAHIALVGHTKRIFTAENAAVLVGAVAGAVASAGVFAGAMAFAMAFAVAIACTGAELLIMLGPRGQRPGVDAIVLMAAKVPISAVVTLGVFSRALYTRLAATLYHPIVGLMSIPANWRQTILSADMFHPPELVPGHALTSFDSFLLKIRNVETVQVLGIAHTPVFFIQALIFYTPTLLWRWAVKSTAWFYLPLLWLGRGWVWDTGDELLVWGKSYVRKLWNWISLVVALLFLCLALAPLIGWGNFVTLSQEARQSGAPWSPLLVLFVLDWSALSAQPWHWFYLPSWTLTIILFFAIDGTRKELDAGGDVAVRLKRLEHYRWLSNLRVVLTNVGLLIALFYVLQAVDAWGQIAEFVTSLMSNLSV